MFKLYQCVLSGLTETEIIIIDAVIDHNYYA